MNTTTLKRFEKLKPKKFETLKDARKWTKMARERGQDFETRKFAGKKRKYQYFSGEWWDWLFVIS